MDFVRNIWLVLRTVVRGVGLAPVEVEANTSFTQRWERIVFVLTGCASQRNRVFKLAAPRVDTSAATNQERLEPAQFSFKVLVAFGVFFLLGMLPKPAIAQTEYPDQASAYAGCVSDPRVAFWAANYGWEASPFCGPVGPKQIGTGYDGYVSTGVWGPFYYYYKSSQLPQPVVRPKNVGGANKNVMVGDPINASTGNKYIEEEDYAGGLWLTLRRYYNSDLEVLTKTPLGSPWRTSFDRSLSITLTNDAPSAITVFRPDDTQEVFTKTGSSWKTDTDIADTLVEIDNAQGVATGFTLTVASVRQAETYSASGLLQTVTDDSGQGISLAYSTSATPVTVAPVSGLLLSVTDAQGRQLGFSYDSSSHLHLVTLPGGGTLTYTHNSAGMLLSVKYPDGGIRQYVYNETALMGGQSLPTAMTGVVDEAGVRYQNTSYDMAGRVTSTNFAGDVNNVTVTYNANGTTSVQHALGLTTTTGFALANGVFKTASVDQPCGAQCGQSFKSLTYDANGYPASATDFNGSITATTYDANGLLDQQIDGLGSAVQRTTNLTWNTTHRVPLTRTVLNASSATVASTAWVYNIVGQPLARCEIDPTNSAASGYTCSNTGTVPAGVRRWTYTYCTAVDTIQCPIVGLLVSVEGPRTDVADVTTYAYYLTDSATSHHGDLQSVTDALGHTTTYLTYDGAGRATSLQDANGVVTTLTYTPRGWLSSRSVGGAITTIGYTPYGEVASITDPDNITTSYTYDAAHRLARITDARGNYVQYTLDAAGNKTQEQIYTASGSVTHSLSRQFNTLGQLTALVDGLSHTVFSAGYSDSYDANGNLVHSADALGTQSHQNFDALNRLTSTIVNYNGTDTATQNTTTTASLDALNRLAGVTDPTALSTIYSYDGLSNRTQLHSPDTGTSSDTYDAAGNRLTHTDAKGIVSTSTYDANNRPTGTGYTDTTLNVSYTYDEANAVTDCSASSPIGRLTRVVEAGVTTVFCYDGRGNVIQKRQVTSSQTDTTLYAYTAGNRLSSESTPDRTAISYTYDSDGRVSGVQVTPSGTTAAPPTVVSSISYLPFGPISSYTLGNGQIVTRTYDANYRLTDLTSPALALHVARDAMGDITAIGNAPGANPALETYSYDPLYRLTAITEASGSVLESYTYNQTGDRLSKTAPGLATGTYLYTTGTHQLASIGNAAQANDANGNTTGSVIGGNTYGFGYNGRNRLTVAQLNGTTVGTYTYNALGQRIGKVATFPQAVTARYAYDEAGNLLGEYGTTNRDYIWLDGMPVAVIDNTINGSVTTSTVDYVTADQLGTPRVVTDGTGTVIWSWAYQGNPFGEQQPASATGYVLNLRYPGQYYDAETGLMYNGPRYYESARGGFDQPDPSGFMGGIGLYVYGLNNPLTYIDPSGLSPPGAPPPMGPFSPEGPPRIPEAGDIPSNIPGGPWTPAGQGQKPGTFWGPKQQQGGKAMCKWRPEGDNGQPPYWKTKAPGQKGWDRWDLNGNWQTPEQAHPGNPPPIEPTKTPEELQIEQEVLLRARMIEIEDGML
jgi:RHS repeat-associated core domain